MKKLLSLTLFIFFAVMTASAQLGNILLPSVDPTSGSTVESLSKITLTFSVDYISYGTDAIYVKNESGESVASVYINDDIMNPNMAIAILSEDITTQGTYSITFPKGFFYETKDDFTTKTGKATQSLTLKYTVEPRQDILKFTADPADKSSVDKLDKVTLTFDTDMIDGMSGYGASDQYGEGAKQIVVYNASGDSITNIVWNYYAGDYTKMVLALDNAITTPGTYTFTLPEGYIWEYDDEYIATGKKTEKTTFTYDVNAPATLTCTADPANGSTIASLSKITLTFPTNMCTGASEYAADAQYSSFGKQVPVYNAAGEKVSSITWDYGKSDYDLILNLSSVISAEGTYTFTLPKGFACEVNSSWEELQITPETTYTYTIGEETGINQMENGEWETENSQSQNPTTYNLAGQRISASAKGIIIRNGKKIMNK